MREEVIYLYVRVPIEDSPLLISGSAIGVAAEGDDQERYARGCRLRNSRGGVRVAGRIARAGRETMAS